MATEKQPPRRKESRDQMRTSQRHHTDILVMNVTKATERAAAVRDTSRTPSMSGKSAILDKLSRVHNMFLPAEIPPVRHRSKRQKIKTLLSLLVVVSMLLGPFTSDLSTAAITTTTSTITTPVTSAASSASTLYRADVAANALTAPGSAAPGQSPTPAAVNAKAGATSSATPPPAPPTSDAGIRVTSVTSDTLPAPRAGAPTPAPTVARPANTNYVDQAVEQKQQALLNEVNALPLAALDANTNSAAINDASGGKVKSRDNTLTVGMRARSVPASSGNGPGSANTNLHVKVAQKQFAKGDARAKHKGMPLAYIYDLTAKKGDAQGTPVETFGKEVALIWNIDLAELKAAGVEGWPLRAYTYDEQQARWIEIPSWWNEDTNQLVALTSHFSLKAVGTGFDKMNNYVPTLSGFEVDLQTGTASASYPINLPAGPGGFGPKVSLSYSSGNADRVDAGQQGSSSVGWGWSLSTSYVAATQHQYGDLFDSRSPWTVSIVSDGVNGDLIKGTDGYWHTANESFAKVKFDQANNRWEAWDANGIYYLFDLRGHVADPYNGNPTVVTNKWMLSKAVDTHGNTVNYSYFYEEKGDPDNAPPWTTPITDPNKRTRAIYPREITYGGAGDGVDKLKVTFHLSQRTDISGADRSSEIFQSKKIHRIDVSRKQQADGQFRVLRSYTLNQDYSIVLGPTNTEYTHLTLKSVTPLGKENTTQAQLPTTTFDYYGNDAPHVRDRGHLKVAKNGYGGEVRYYYDGAAEDVHESYRRVRAKRVRDGLTPIVADELSTQSTPHDALYQYEYRGAATNNAGLSGESNTTDPLHVVDSEWRGFAWVREFNPSGQVVEHYYSQDDVTKGKEWRTQTGKADVFTSDMSGTPTTNADWTVSGPVTLLNGTWKLAPASSPTTASVSRTGTVFDGSTVTSRFQIAGPGDGHILGTWKLKRTSGTNPNDAWGLQIRKNSNRYDAWVQWTVNGVSGERLLTNFNNTNTVRPFRIGGIERGMWYTLYLHTSPDGRFGLELSRDNRDYIQVKSGDLALPTSTIPLFPVGQNWRFEQTTSVAPSTTTNDHVLLDAHKETRTVYSQSDTWYEEMPPVGPSPVNDTVWQPGLENNADGMAIHLPKVTRTWTTTYGNACCQLGQYLRIMTDYVYNDAYRNLTAMFEYGNYDAQGDERSTFHGYHNVANVPTRYLPGLKKWTHVYKGITGDVLGANWMMNSVFIYDGSSSWDYVSPTTKGVMIEAQRYNMREGAGTPGAPSYVSQKVVYDAYGHQVQSIDGNNVAGPLTSYDLYYHAFPVTVAFPNGRTESTVWDYTLDVPQSSTDMNNVTTETRYDDFGRPTKSWIPTDALGSEAVPNEEYILPGLNQPVVTPPFYIKYKLRLGLQAGTNEHTWQTRWFDGRGRTIQDVSPRQGSNTVRVDTAYTINGQFEKATLPFEVTVTAPDAYRVPTWTQPKISTEYDGLGRPTREVNPDGNYVAYVYSWLQRVDRHDEALHWKFTYTDVYGRISTVIEYDTSDPGYLPQNVANHIATEYTYDVLDNQMSVKRNAWVSAPNTPVVTTMEYDGLGRKKAMNDPDMGRWEYGYDNGGNLISQKDALYLSNPTDFANHLLLIDYDNMNRPTAKYYGQTHKNSNLADVRFYYDNALSDAGTVRSWGRLRKAEVTGVDGQSTKANSHSYVYDTRGQLWSETINSALARNNGDYTVGYRYDTAGRLDSVIYPDPDAQHEQVDVTYNQQAMGLPTRLDSNKDAGIYPVEGVNYNARGQIKEIYQGSQGPTSDLLKTVYGYDDATTARGWLTSTIVTTGGGTTLLDLNMTYESNGNVKTVSQNAVGANSPTFINTFNYDQKDRLVSATSAGTNGNASLWPAESYTFDDIHRMRTRTIGGIANTYTYPASSGTGSHPDAPTAYQGVTYQYDANGNQIARIKNGVTETRTFDPEGRMVKINDGTTVTEYIYDANGQRLIKTVTTALPTPTATPSTGLRGEYYSGTSFNDYKLTRYDSAIDFSWGTGSPDPALPADGFSARWTGNVYAPPSDVGPNVDTSYTLGVTSDAGVRVWVNGVLRIDNWTAHSAVENRSSFTLKSNRVYPIKVEYYEGSTTANATLQMYWLKRNTLACQVDPSACWSRGLPMELTPPSSGGSLLAEYYDNSNFTGLKFTRNDPGVRFDWGNAAPDASMGVDTFSVKWSGKVTATTSGTYTFYTMSDDGVRLWVNGQQLVNNWTDHAPTENSGQIALNAGQQYDIRLEYYENGYGARVELLWLPPGGAKQTIPPGQFSPAAVPNNTSRMIYISGLYEEDITPGSTTTQYTSYYTLGGKVVGMRKVVGTTSTQYRIVGDHLGSTSLIVDAQPTPQVVQRTYHKPYGEVAWNWSASESGPTALTSMGYTGQRLEIESGLMYYGARFYDPVLSYFVSADTIAPGKGDARTRNRYSYVLNNPLRYTDPTGHCHKDNHPSGSEDCRKQAAAEELALYGFELLEGCYDNGDCTGFTAEDLELILAAIKDFMRTAQMTSIDEFKQLLGTDREKIYLTNQDWDSHRASRHVISLNLPSLRAEGDAKFKFVFVHELAHVWDQRNEWRHSDGMHDELYESREGACSGGGATWSPLCDNKKDMSKSKRGSGSPTSEYGNTNRVEDWAEAVAEEVYPTVQRNTDPVTGSKENYSGGRTARSRYVREKMGIPTPCTPGKAC